MMMEPKPQKQSTNEKKKSDHSVRKYLAVATMAASMGLSLGVPVGDVLAANERMSSPPDYSVSDKKNVSSEKMKSSVQSNQVKLKSNREKLESNQGKLESKQFKFKQGQKVESQN